MTQANWIAHERYVCYCKVITYESYLPFDAKNVVNNGYMSIKRDWIPQADLLDMSILCMHSV